MFLQGVVNSEVAMLRRDVAVSLGVIGAARELY